MNNKFPKALRLKFSEIQVGSQYSFNRTFSNSDILSFAKLTGDFNPIHVNFKHGHSLFKENIVHGMLIGGLFSTLVGMYCPGEDCLYLSQEIEFIKPVYPNQEVNVKGVILNKVESLQILCIKTEIFVNGKIVVQGQAKVKVLNDE